MDKRRTVEILITFLLILLKIFFVFHQAHLCKLPRISEVYDCIVC